MKIKTLMSIVLISSTLSSVVHSESTKSLMKDVYTAFVKLIPYTSSRLKFTDPSHSEHIQKNIEN